MSPANIPPGPKPTTTGGGSGAGPFGSSNTYGSAMRTERSLSFRTSLPSSASTLTRAAQTKCTRSFFLASTDFFASSTLTMALSGRRSFLAAARFRSSPVKPSPRRRFDIWSTLPPPSFYPRHSPAVSPVAKAQCRLYPPQSPSTSKSSPQRYSPLQSRDSIVDMSTSERGTPPAVT